jgi:hypothetical protein
MSHLKNGILLNAIQKEAEAEVGEKIERIHIVFPGKNRLCL